MAEQDLAILRRLQSGVIGEPELLVIFEHYRDNRRILLALVCHPRFPIQKAIAILSGLFPSDLLRVIKDMRTNPFVRKRAEIEFSIRYRKLPLGEKISLLRIAPGTLLSYFSNENHPKLLPIILQNQNCSEEIVLRLINREIERHTVYDALAETEWYKRPGVATAIAHDIEAPIRIVLLTLPYMRLVDLQVVFAHASTHEIVRHNIKLLLEKRHSETD